MGFFGNRLAKMFVVSLAVARKEPRRVGKHAAITGLWSAGNEGTERKMETNIMGFIGTLVRIHSLIPS